MMALQVNWFIAGFLIGLVIALIVYNFTRPPGATEAIRTDAGDEPDSCPRTGLDYAYVSTTVVTNPKGYKGSAVLIRNARCGSAIWVGVTDQPPPMRKLESGGEWMLDNVDDLAMVIAKTMPKTPPTRKP